MRRARMVALGALGLYLAGSVYALIGHHADAFQRFGSLGVAAAILFFTDRLAQVEMSRRVSVERVLHEYGLELEVMKEGLDPRDLPRTGFDTDYLEEEQKFTHLRHTADRINSRNIVLLTLATLQWGFGDLILRWVTTL